MSNASSSAAANATSTRTELAATLSNPGPTNASTLKGIANAVCLFGSDFLASWTAYSGALVVCHPIDTLRLRKQTYGQSVAFTIRHDGLRSLYAGALTPLFATGPLVAVAFALNEVFRVFARWVNVTAFGRVELANAPYFTVGELVCGGAMAGATTSVLQCPVTFTRVQQQTSARAGRHAPSATHVYRSVVQFEGVGGMWRAFRAEASAGAIGRASYFSSYEVLKGWFSGVLGPEQKWLAAPVTPARAVATAAGTTSATTSGRLHVELPGEDPLLLLPPNPMYAGAHRFVSSTVTRNVAAASVTSTLGWVFIFPLEVVKVKLQADAIDPAQRRYKGIMDCSRQIMREQGVRGFWVGFCLSITRSWISSGLALPLFEYLKPKYRAYAPRLEE